MDKKKARLNSIAHLRSQMPYQEVAKPPIDALGVSHAVTARRSD